MPFSAEFHALLDTAPRGHVELGADYSWRLTQAGGGIEILARGFAHIGTVGFTCRPIWASRGGTLRERPFKTLDEAFRWFNGTPG